MKKAMKNLMVLVLLGFTAFANATTPTVPYVTFEQVAEQKVRVNLTNLKSERPELSIIDAEGIIVYSEVISQSVAITKAYDLSELPNGSYTLKLELNDRIVKQDATIENNDLTLGDFKEVSKPIYKMFEDGFDLYIADITKTNVTIEILDENGESIDKRLNEDVNGLHRQYIIKDLPVGTYTVRVEFDDNIFYKTLSVK